MTSNIKSSRHSKITGDFAERFVLYWLSRRGFECVHVDHTGIDLIAVNPDTNERMGISVKSRSRYAGTEADSITVHDSADLRKVMAACQAFGCQPYFAVVAETRDKLMAFLLSAQKFRTLFGEKQIEVFTWKMNEKNLSKYRADPEIQMVEYERKLAHPTW